MMYPKKNKHKDVGGLNCPCCRPLPSKTKSKKFISKHERRLCKQSLRRLDDDDTCAESIEELLGE